MMAKHKHTPKVQKTGSIRCKDCHDLMWTKGR